MSCNIERTRSDATPIAPRRSDDGLCGTCRDLDKPAIPDHDPADHLTPRAEHLAATRPATAVRAILRADWAQTTKPEHRTQIEDWVRQHLPPTTDLGHRPPTDNPLIALTDTQLAERITDLEQQLVLAAASASVYSPIPTECTRPRDVEAIHTRRADAQAAIRIALDAEDQHRDATRALHAARTELATHRQQLDVTPPRQRRTRKALRTRIDELVAEELRHERHHTRTRAHVRRTHRYATSLAGPPENWQKVLNTMAYSHEADAQRAVETVDTAEQDFITRTRTDIDWLRSEQHRRQALIPGQRKHDPQLHRTQPLDTSFDHDANETQPAPDSAFDLDL